MGSTTTDLALYLKYTSIPTKDPSVNQNKPDSDHQSSRWFSPSIFSTQLLPLRPEYELVYICLIFCINMLNLSFTRERKSSCSSSFFAVFTWLFTIKSLVKRPSINTAVALRQLCVRLLSYYFLLFCQIEVQ